MTTSVTSNYQAAVDLLATGNLEAASRQFEELLRNEPNDARIITQLALVRLQQGRLPESIDLGNRAVGIDSSNAVAHAWLGEARRRCGELMEAVESFSAALRLRPDLAPAHFNMALALADLNRTVEAREAWLAFLALRPKDPRIRAELGKLAMHQGDYDEAQRWFTQQCNEFPSDVNSYCDLAAALLAKGEHDRARSVIVPILQRTKIHPRPWLTLARSLSSEGRHQDASQVIEQAIRHLPQNVELLTFQGHLADRLANLPGAIAAFEEALSIEPSNATTWNAVGVAHLNFANHDQAVRAFRKAMQLDPSFAAAHSNLLMALHYEEDVSPAQIFDEHLRYSSIHATDAARILKVAPPQPGERIRVGYLSPRFGEGPIAHFVLPLLRFHDHTAFEIFCYSTSAEEDAATQEMKACADVWRACAGVSDAALSDLIQGDQIQILVDLVGHCPGGRLQMLSQRVAPIQVTWMDYVDTTGLSTIDYILTDEGHTPVGTPQRYSEQVIRLRDVRLCYAPTLPLAPLAPPPLLRRGYATFGCFNRLSKLGQPVLDAWARIMEQVPSSHLVLKATSFGAQQTCDEVVRRFAQRGVASDRLELRRFSDEASMMQEYADVDIALDPFPYNGCTTTCDALAMGVPVVSLVGTTLAGRHGVSILTAVGRSDFLTRTVGEYVTLAVALARDPDLLGVLRPQLRSQFLSSPMCDARSFARSVEQAFNRMVSLKWGV